MSKVLGQKSKLESEKSARFLCLSTHLASIATKDGVHYHPYFDPRLKVFSSLSPQQQQNALSSLETYIGICELTQANGARLRDNKSLLWYALKSMKLRFSSDLFDLISEEDTIEIYDAENIQIFRNLQAMSLLSYSLEDLFCHTWMELFSRENPEIVENIQKTAIEMFTSNSNSARPMSHLGFQKVRESRSPLKYEYNLMVKYLAPLLDDNGHVVALMAIEDVQSVGKKLSREEEAERYAQYQREIAANQIRKKRSPDLTII
ncbi:MAG: hypothetical protein H6624_04420 [Bdellovibrionaceae bacterium]|nr:hypothetical protein [Bdellovibrionales bacterium]MCB9083561.1 hypothetical protein [Pseudobdellovibrionaceae bacterium]